MSSFSISLHAHAHSEPDPTPPTSIKTNNVLIAFLVFLVHAAALLRMSCAQPAPVDVLSQDADLNQQVSEVLHSLHPVQNQFQTLLQQCDAESARKLLRSQFPSATLTPAQQLVMAMSLDEHMPDFAYSTLLELKGNRPSLPLIRSQIGLHHHRLGQYAAALVEYEAFIQVYPASEVNWYAMACAVELGDYDSVLRFWELLGATGQIMPTARLGRPFTRRITLTPDMDHCEHVQRVFGGKEADAEALLLSDLRYAPFQSELLINKTMIAHGLNIVIERHPKPSPRLAEIIFVASCASYGGNNALREPPHTAITKSGLLKRPEYKLPATSEVVPPMVFAALDCGFMDQDVARNELVPKLLERAASEKSALLFRLAIYLTANNPGHRRLDPDPAMQMTLIAIARMTLAISDDSDTAELLINLLKRDNAASNLAEIRELTRRFPDTSEAALDAVERAEQSQHNLTAALQHAIRVEFRSPFSAAFPDPEPNDTRLREYLTKLANLRASQK